MVFLQPATFARDARTLVDGGFKLSEVTPIDQFLWATHVELVANSSANVALLARPRDLIS